MENTKTEGLRDLKKLVQDGIKKGLKEIFGGGGQEVTGASSFPLRTARQVAKIFFVSPSTVKDWHRKGLLRGRYQILSGRSCRLVFANSELERFFKDNFPALEDLSDHPCNPRQGSKPARLIQKIFAMNQLYSRRRQRAVPESE